MAIEYYNKVKSVPSDGKIEMSMAQFIEWLKQFDKDKDGRISRDELREAIRNYGGWFSTWNSYKGVKNADKDGNGFIDETEYKNLAGFAQKQLGVRIVPY